MAKTADFLIIGGGIAGSSAASAVASLGKTILIEAEAQLAYHTTGRSAAFYAESYGGPKVQPLSAASADFLFETPEGFSESPLTEKRGVFYIVAPGQEEEAAQEARLLQLQSPQIELVAADEVLGRLPMLRPENVAGGLWDPTCSLMDVHALHQGFLKTAKQADLDVMVGAPVEALRFANGVWRAETREGAFEAPVVINAAGAWGDHVARMAGVKPLGLEPRRRTIITFMPDSGTIDTSWPLTIDFKEEWYFKPESGRILASPADETLSEACDAQPEEIDIAIAIDRLERVTSWKIPKIEAKWAGLRTFAPDRVPVIGFEPDAQGFFWYVGQGGYGIQTAPAAAQLLGCLIAGQSPSQHLQRYGVRPEIYGPARLRGR